MRSSFWKERQKDQDSFWFKQRNVGNQKLFSFLQMSFPPLTPITSNLFRKVKEINITRLWINYILRNWLLFAVCYYVWLRIELRLLHLNESVATRSRQMMFHATLMLTVWNYNYMKKTITRIISVIPVRSDVKEHLDATVPLIPLKWYITTILLDPNGLTERCQVSRQNLKSFRRSRIFSRKLPFSNPFCIIYNIQLFSKRNKNEILYYLMRDLLNHIKL